MDYGIIHAKEKMRFYFFLIRIFLKVSPIEFEINEEFPYFLFEKQIIKGFSIKKKKEIIF